MPFTAKIMLNFVNKKKTPELFDNWLVFNNEYKKKNPSNVQIERSKITLVNVQRVVIVDIESFWELCFEMNAKCTVFCCHWDSRIEIDSV